MDWMALKYVGIGLSTIGMMGAAIGVGSIISALLRSLARNPSAEPQLSKYAFIGCGLAEAMGLFAFLLAMLLMYGKID